MLNRLDDRSPRLVVALHALEAASPVLVDSRRRLVNALIRLAASPRCLVGVP
jgi:hypothetical protein